MYKTFDHKFYLLAAVVTLPFLHGRAHISCKKKAVYEGGERKTYDTGCCLIASRCAATRILEIVNIRFTVC